MKHRLTFKFIVAYVIFGILAFLVVAVFGSRLCRRAAVKTAADELYREVRVIASEQSASYASRHSYDPSFLTRYDSITDCRVLILDTGGLTGRFTGSFSAFFRRSLPR